jgi:hypothetical protein
LTPDELHVPGTNIRRITPEADRAWIARMAELTKTKEYEREAERRTDLAKKAESSPRARHRTSPRRTYLHLSYSYAAPFGPALFVTQDPEQT